MMKTPLYLIAVSAIMLGLPAYGQVSTLASKDKPVEVTSDALEVFQSENRAVFSGNVVAVQGDIKLKADKMNIHYRKAAEKTSQSQSIQKIEVEGNVFLATPEETASGASGLYDVDAHTITLNTNVVLTKGQNTLKGDHLVYNMETGKSVLNSGASGSETGGKPQRVKALFVPENKK